MAKSILRNVLVTCITIIVLAVIVIPILQARWEKRQKIERLKETLRLLEAKIQTGITQPDFLDQMSKLIAEHLAVREFLRPADEKQLTRIAICLETDRLFFEKKLEISSVEFGAGVGELDSFINPFAAQFGINKQWGYAAFAYAGVDQKKFGYVFNDAFQLVLSDTVDDIDAFLNGRDCPWPKA